jgi:hypothetical protein
MERGLILYIARLIVTVCKPWQRESMNVETVDSVYVPGPDGHLR